MMNAIETTDSVTESVNEPKGKSFGCYVIGDDSLTMQCCEELLCRGHKIFGVVCSSPDVKNWSEENGVPCFDADEFGAVEAVIREQPFDLLFSVANLRILPLEVVALAKCGAINFHDGLLPDYAGVHTTSWALINQERKHGVTWHYIGDVVDGGDILVQRLLPIADGETAFSLNSRCLEAGIETFGEVLDALEQGTERRITQNSENLRYFRKYDRPKAAGVISWRQKATEIYALVRALNFGPILNPLGCAKIKLGGDYYVCQKASAMDDEVCEEPGAVLEISEESIRVTTARGVLQIEKLCDLAGNEITLGEVGSRHQIVAGCNLPEPSETEREELTTVNGRLCKTESFWVEKLKDLRPIAVPDFLAPSKAVADDETILEIGVAVDLDSVLGGGEHSVSRQEVLLAAFALYLNRVSGEKGFDLGYRLRADRFVHEAIECLYSQVVPLRVEVAENGRFSEECPRLADEWRKTLKKGTYAREVALRYPELTGLRDGRLQPALDFQVELVDSLAMKASDVEFAVRLIVTAEAKECLLRINLEKVGRVGARMMVRQFETWLKEVAANDKSTLGEISVLSHEERFKLIESWNSTEVEFPNERTIHELFEEHALKTPDAVALVCRDQALTYQQLDSRSNQLGRYLMKLGVRPDTLVGLSVDRSADMVVGLLGILKAGGAYVPLDPAYPAERTVFMLEDSGAAVLLTQQNLSDRMPDHQAKVVCLDSDWEAISKEDASSIHSGASLKNLAYVIYTSGSTGKPKGVMVEHRNVVNFFAGMAERIEIEQDSTWLAVTSLSFDISVLEIFWTLARGIRVVIYPGAEYETTSKPKSPVQSSGRPMDFSLFYFSADQGEDAANKYRLLMKGAKFADENGFKAVWTPERHFHDFGGLYPNPSVTGAALAVTTKKVQIRSGSVVAPLHSPIRVAEEWSVVDNLSGGRVGVSFASGWMPDDFVIMPENYAERKALMFESIDKVRQLWRGEPVEFADPLGDNIDVRTQPRPIQKDLPVWVTTAGNPETYIEAAKAGANVLTHLLGQSIDEVAEKVELYRKTWSEVGHPGRGHVSLMLHTFVSDCPDFVKSTVRKPMREYLRTSAGLVKKYSWSFPTFKRLGKSAHEANFGDLNEEEMDALLDHAFDRYFESSGLFGTPESCLERIEQLKANDIDEVACLIDFGVATDVVLANLCHLNSLRSATSGGRNEAGENHDEDQTIPALIDRHKVTHFQCTPSMANMLLVDTEAKDALAGLDCWLIGGEAFPPSLAREIGSFFRGQVINMYGPTETTIWSTTHVVEGVDKSIPIGRPIANTQIYIVDDKGRLVPPGVPGELFIGGEGVVRGYHNRSDLTRERFVPFQVAKGGSDSVKRVYRTGDLTRYMPNGTIEFLGRIDHQVKLRGHRIELGEIEQRLCEHGDVREAVVVAREDQPGDKRLVAYVRLGSGNGGAIGFRQLREHLRERLPEYMVPSHIVKMESLPQTPNKKVDRNQLPAPTLAQHSEDEEGSGSEPPSTEMEESMAELWMDALGIERISRDDNFFDLGGHSLSAVQISASISEKFGVKFPLHEFMEEPVLSALARKVEDLLLSDVDSDELEAMLDKIEGIGLSINTNF